MRTEFRGIDLARLAEQIDQYASSVRSLTTHDSGEDEAECERLLKSIASEMVKNSNLIHELLYPLTDEQRKIALQAAEEVVYEYDADDLQEIALIEATDTHEKLCGWFKRAEEEE